MVSAVSVGIAPPLHKVFLTGHSKVALTPSGDDIQDLEVQNEPLSLPEITAGVMKCFGRPHLPTRPLATLPAIHSAPVQGKESSLFEEKAVLGCGS